MKKVSCLTIFVIIVYLLIFKGICFGQWEQDLRLTSDPSGSYTRGSGSSWCLGTNGQIVHTVWHDYRNGNWEIYYKRSTDGGTNWETDTRITNDPGQSATASIAVSGSFVHLVWCDIRNGNYDIYYRRSSNNGTNWDIETRITYDTSVSDYPCITASGQNIYVVWQDSRNNNQEIYFKSSTNAGLNWSSDIRCTNDTSISKLPSLSVSGTNINVMWEDTRDGNNEIYYMKSTNGGNIWGPNQRLTYNTSTSQFPSLSSSGLFLHAVWYDDRDGNWEIYYKRSTDGGLTWNADQRLTNNPGISSVPSVTSSGPIVHVAWVDDRDGGAFTSEIYYKRSFNNGFNWENDTRLTYDAAVSLNPSISVSGSLSNVVWSDARNGDFEIYYKRNPTGNQEIFQAPLNLTYNSTENRLTWALSPSTNVSKYLVYKKGSDNIWKSVADSGGMVNSNQNYYNIQVSGFCYYRVAAISNTGDTAKCDSIYVNRGYVLRNWNSGILEVFKVNKHGFNFGNHDTLANGEPLLWNSFWYSQFNYTSSPYPYYFRLFSKSADYPDWPLFTNVYGHNKCYIYYFKPGNILDSTFIIRSVSRWSNIKYRPVVSGKRPIETWRGACFGFSLSSLLAFYKNTSFYNQFPIMYNVDSAYGLLPSTAVKNMINHLQQTQNFIDPKTKYQEPHDSINQNPVYVLNLLEDKFSKITTQGRLNEILGIYYNGDGGHAVVPYAIEKLNESVKLLYIYDNEYPANDNVRLVINTITNICYHSQNNRVINRMLLAGSLDSYLGEQSDCKSLFSYNYSKYNANDSIIIFNATNSSSFYINKFGDTISGFRITDNKYIGNKNLAFSQMTDGRVNPPLYYKIQNNGFVKIVFNNFMSNDQTSFVSFDIDSNTTYKIERIDSTQTNQSDIFFVDSNRLSFTNINPLQKKLIIMAIFSENLITKKEKAFEIDNFKMINNDSVFVNKINNDLAIKSEGSAKIYCLRLNYLDSSGSKTFYNPNISLANNSTHIISPVWDSIKTKPVKIYVDLGNNGTIDDTLYISDTVLTKVKNINDETPNKYILYQNYPNPFNPVTKIQYALPNNVFVKLEIFDILGRKVETLVNEKQTPGVYDATWEASNYPSGVYFYKLEAESFSETKKMILIK